MGLECIFLVAVSQPQIFKIARIVSCCGSSIERVLRLTADAASLAQIITPAELFDSSKELADPALIKSRGDWCFVGFFEM